MKKIKTLHTMLREASAQGSFASRISDNDPRLDWIVGPVGVHRESALYERANWEAVTREFAKLDPEGLDYEVIRFGHYAVGWVDELIRRPDTAIARAAERIREGLEQYPIVDEDVLSELEMEDLDENLPNIMHDLRGEIADELAREDYPEDYGDLLHEITDDQLYTLSHDRGELDDGWIRFSKRDVRELAALVVPALAIAHACASLRGDS